MKKIFKYLLLVIIIGTIISLFISTRNSDNKYAKRLGFEKANISDYYLEDKLILKIDLFNQVSKEVLMDVFLSNSAGDLSKELCSKYGADNYEFVVVEYHDKEGISLIKNGNAILAESISYEFNVSTDLGLKSH